VKPKPVFETIKTTGILSVYFIFQYKYGRKNNRFRWFCCWMVATPTCLLFCTGKCTL